MSYKLASAIAATSLFMAACGASTTEVGSPSTDEVAQPTTTDSPPESSDPTDLSRPPTTPEDPATTSTTIPLSGSTGTLAVHLQPVDGVFIEGFEAGLRFETSDGQVIYATLWTDFVESTGSTNLRDYYDTVLERAVPAGPVVVLATLNIGAGPGPVVPDINGDLRCRLELDVPDDGLAEVELAFDSQGDCLTQTN